MTRACKPFTRGLLVGMVLLSMAMLVRAAEDGAAGRAGKATSKTKSNSATNKASGKDKAKPGSADKALDDALLNDLDNELLEGAGDLRNSKPPAKSAAPGGTTEKPAVPKGLDPRDGADNESAKENMPDDAAKVGADKDALGEDLGEASPEDDPLGYIGQEMRKVERLIPEQARREHARQLQDRITEDLAKLIEQAENQAAAQQAQKSSKSQQKSQRAGVNQPKNGKPGKDSNQPANDSTERMGKADQAKPDPAARQGLLKQAWGHLPERTRDQMLQNPPERFLPQYELMIERYYRRLAEERNNK